MAPAEATKNLIDALLALAADLGDGRQMAVLGEGNVSGRVSGRVPGGDGPGRFFVKASGTRLAGLTAPQLVEVEAAPLLEAMQPVRGLPDEAVERLLLEARVDPAALKPSVESLFHAWLLTLPDVYFVGHVHPVAVNALLCSARARDFAVKRLIPDQVVYCGAESVRVPYVDPGLALARSIAGEVEAYRRRAGRVPKTILLENHGLIALGRRHEDVIAAVTMAEKAARIFIGAAALGGPVFMEDADVRRIEGRLDEHYRQRML